jgi:hypothetical protein
VRSPTRDGAGTTTTTDYYSTPGGQHIAIAANGQLSYVVGDGLGSTTAALDGKGNVQATQLYTPYGGVRYQNQRSLGAFQQRRRRRRDVGRCRFLDEGNAFAGYDICTSSPYANRLVPNDTQESCHPNADGYTKLASHLYGAIGQGF